MIYHITTRADWETQADQPLYEAASLHTEGFIHLSTKEQVVGVLDRYFPESLSHPGGIPDLLLLHVDPNKLTGDLRYEAATNNEHFPHLYAALNKDAVVMVEPIDRRSSVA